MRQDHAFRPAAGARGVQEHRRRVRIQNHCLRWSGVEQHGKIIIEHQDRQIQRTKRTACLVAQHQLRITIAEDRCNSTCRQLPVYRHRDESSPDAAEKG